MGEDYYNDTDDYGEMRVIYSIFDEDGNIVERQGVQFDVPAGGEVRTDERLEKVKER